MTGHRTWLGDEGLRIVACHQEGELAIIRDVVLDFKPELMVELGTCVGGITLLLHQCFPDIPLHSFDNKSIVKSAKKARSSLTIELLERFQKEAFNENVEFHVADVFADGKYIVECLLTSEKRKFLYCDNGNKDMEINLFAKCLSIGDVLGVHDWGFEVGWEWAGVKETLSSFEEMSINETLRDKFLTARFFRKIK